MQWDQSYTKNGGKLETLHSGSRVIFPIVTNLYTYSSRKDYFYKHDAQYNKKPEVSVQMLRIFFNKEDCD